MEPVIEVEGLVKHFPVRSGFMGRQVNYLRAVDGVSFALHRGETLGLVGESGCGKSTVGYLVLNLLTPNKGTVRFKGAQISRLRGKALREVRRRLQVVFQDPQSSLDPRMMVKKTVGAPLEVHRLARGAEAVRRVRAIRSEVGLNEEHVYARFPGAEEGLKARTRPKDEDENPPLREETMALARIGGDEVRDPPGEEDAGGGTAGGQAGIDAHVIDGHQHAGESAEDVDGGDAGEAGPGGVRHGDHGAADPSGAQQAGDGLTAISSDYT